MACSIWERWIVPLRFTSSSAEYLLSVSAVGYRSIRRRLMVDAAMPSIVDVVLVPFIDEVGAVVVKADRAPPPPFSYEPRLGSTATIASGVQAVTPVTMDGVVEMLRNNLWMDGVGAFGLSASESAVQLNGLTVGLTTLPRSLPVAIQAGIGEYDIFHWRVQRCADRWTCNRRPSSRVGSGHFSWENRRSGARSANARLTGWRHGYRIFAIGVSGPGIAWGLVRHGPRGPPESLESDSHVLSFRSAAMARELWQSSPCHAHHVWSGTSLVRIDFAPDQRRGNALIGSLGWCAKLYLGVCQEWILRQGHSPGISHFASPSAHLGTNRVGYAVERQRDLAACQLLPPPTDDSSPVTGARCD